jgi:MFS family permease
MDESFSVKQTVPERYQSGLRTNIWKFYVVRIFLRSFVFPILVVYFLKSGLSAAQIGLVFSIGIFASFLLELPSGYISDKIGHKQAIIACFIMKAVAMLCYLGGSFWWFILAEILFVGGGALWSGTGEAFFYETMKDLNRLDDFEKLYGRSKMVSLSAGSGLLIAMPFIYAQNNQIVFYINSVLLLIPILFSFTLRQPHMSKQVAKVEGWMNVVHEWRSIGRFIIEQKRYRAIIFFFAFWQAAQDAIDIFSQLFFLFVGIPAKFFGILYAVNRLLQGAGGQVAYLLKKALNSLQILALFSIELALFFFAGAYANQFIGTILFPVRNFFEGVSDPLSSGMVNKEIVHGNRITLLSVEPTISSLIEGVLVLVMGFLFNTFSVAHVFLILGIAIAIGLAFLYITAVRALDSGKAVVLN